MRVNPLISTGIVGLVLLGLLSLPVANADRTPLEGNDLDRDGMDDDWEGQNGLDNRTNDASEDKDSDGMTNIEEYLDFTDPDDPERSRRLEDNRMLVFIGVGIAMGVAAICSSLGIGIAGAGAAGVTAERPDKFGKLLVYQALPMTQGIYGLLISILVLNFTGFTGGPKVEILSSPFVGWGALAIGIVIALSSFSAIPQGMTAAAAASAFGRNNEVFGKGVLFSVMSETMAIFGLLVAIFLLLASGMLG